MSSRRLRTWWSTHVPTNSDSRFGAQTAAVSRPTVGALACRAVTAIRGSASSVIRSPNCETPWPTQ